MKTAQVVLHGLPGELLSWVDKRLQSEALSAAVVRVDPAFSVYEVGTPEELTKRRNFTPRVPFRVCLSREPFDCSLQTLHAFMVENPSECVVDIGTMNDQGLKESAISTSVANPGQTKFWASAIKELKAMTRAGLWAVNPQTGARTLQKNNRYTQGAERFAATGGKLLPLAGWNHFEITAGRID